MNIEEYRNLYYTVKKFKVKTIQGERPKAVYYYHGRYITAILKYASAFTKKEEYINFDIESYMENEKDLAFVLESVPKNKVAEFIELGKAMSEMFVIRYGRENNILTDEDIENYSFKYIDKDILNTRIY